MIECIDISSSDIDKVWTIVSPLLDKALDKWLPVWDINDIYEELLSSNKKLWIVIDNDKEKVYGAIVTEIVQFPKEKLLNVILIGGNSTKGWKNIFVDRLLIHAKEEKCYAMQGFGRKGWGKIFPENLQSAAIFSKIIVY